MEIARKPGDDRYMVMNLWRGKMHEQGDHATKAKAVRQARDDAARTHAGNERFNTPAEERSELFIVVDRHTGEVVGGQAVVTG